MKFNKKENEVLTETYRRLNFFHNGDLDTNLLLLSRPHEVKTLKEKGILKPFSTEVPRALNWYNLTNDGKELFKSYVLKRRLSEKTNLAIFEGKFVKNFSSTNS